MASTQLSPADDRRDDRPDDLASPVQPEPARPPALGPLGWVRWAWRQLTSMRTALLLLFLLALAAVPGSVFPQRGVDPGAVAAYARERPALFPWLDRLSLFDVYASPWFSAVYLLLFTSLAGCVLPRSRAHWAALRARPPAAPRHLGRLPVSRSWVTDAAPGDVVEAARRALRGERFRVDATAATVSAEKGYLRETGNLVFHLALLLVLVAVAAGHLGGYTGGVLVPEGRSFANTLIQYDEFRGGARFDSAGLAPFSVTLDRLEARFEEEGSQRGAPREFAAHVRYRESPEQEQQAATIRPNQPLVVGEGLARSKVFLLGNGYAPRITVRNGGGDVVWQGPAPTLPSDAPGMASTGVLKVPDAGRSAADQLGFGLTFLPTAVQTPFAGTVSVFPDAQNPRLLVTGAWRGDLGLTAGPRPQPLARLDTSRMTQLADPADAGRPLTAELAPGATLTLPDGLGTLTFDGVARFANFSVASNPGSTPALAAAVLAVAGLLGSLFVRRRRVFVRVTDAPSDSAEPAAPGAPAVAATGSPAPAGRRTVVEIGGLARSDHDGLADEVDRVRAQVLQAAPARPAAHEEEGRPWATPRSRS